MGPRWLRKSAKSVIECNFHGSISAETIRSVGLVPSAKSIFALAFNGSQLYAGASAGFYVFGASSDITQCSGNANNCGTPKLLMGGTSVNGVVSDGLGHVYLVAGNPGICTAIISRLGPSLG